MLDDFIRVYHHRLLDKSDNWTLEQKGFFLNILCLAGMSNFYGKICITDKKGYRENGLCDLFNCSLDQLKDNLKFFQDNEFISIDDFRIITVLNWGKYQIKPDSIRKREQRERDKISDIVPKCHADVTDLSQECHTDVTSGHANNLILQYSNNQIKNVKKEKKPIPLPKIDFMCELEKILYPEQITRFMELFNPYNSLEASELLNDIKIFGPDVFKDSVNAWIRASDKSNKPLTYFKRILENKSQEKCKNEEQDEPEQLIKPLYTSKNILYSTKEAEKYKYVVSISGKRFPIESVCSDEIIIQLENGEYGTLKPERIDRYEELKAGKNGNN